MSERIYASDGRFIGVTGDEKDARIAELEAKNERLLVAVRGGRGIRERLYRALKELDELAAIAGGE